MSDRIAVGTPVFSRTEALHNLLESLPSYVETAYVADNGPENAHERVYNQDWPFDLEVIDLGYDVGIGACRSAICEAVEEPYLFMCDSDMEIVRNSDLEVLQSILEANPDLGGVSGWLIEDNVVRAGARDIEIYEQTAIKSVQNPQVEGDIPFARFDFIPQACLFRTALFDDYPYDPSLRGSEHMDFFFAHKQTNWDFASTPTVMIEHNRNINEEYRNSTRGGNHVDMDVLEEKWGINNIVPGPYADWGYVRGRSLSEQVFEVFRRATPPKVWIPARKALKVIA